MLRDCKEVRQYLSTKSFQGERRPMVLYVESITTQANLFHSCLLNSTSTIPMMYTGDRMPVVGEMKVEVSYAWGAEC